MSSNSDPNATNGNGDQDDQQLELTTEEALVLRGAINVLRELAVRHDLEPEVAIPLNSGRARVFEAVRDRLGTRLDDPARARDATIRERLTPAEAQAVRDAAGVLSTLLRDPGGREILAIVGFLPDPDADVDREEVALLDDVADRLEPTGVRTVTGAEATGRASTEIINPTRSLAAIIATAESEIAQAELPWPGLEQAVFSLRGTADSAPGLDCDQLLKTLVASVKLVVGGTRLSDPGDRDEFADDARAALRTVVNGIDNEGCVPPAAVETIGADATRLVNSLQAGGETIDAAEQLLTDLQDVTSTRDPAAEAGTIPLTRPSEIDDPHRQRIEQLREETGTVLEQTRDDPLAPHDVDDNVVAALPSSTAGCGALLVALAELGQVMAQVVVSQRVRRGQSPPQGEAFTRVNRARQQVLASLQQKGCLDDAASRDLRSSFLSVHDPLESDPSDIGTRTYAFLSDVRQAYLALDPD